MLPSSPQRIPDVWLRKRLEEEERREGIRRSIPNRQGGGGGACWNERRRNETGQTIPERPIRTQNTLARISRKCRNCRKYYSIYIIFRFAIWSSFLKSRARRDKNPNFFSNVPLADTTNRLSEVFEKVPKITQVKHFLLFMSLSSFPTF